MAVEKISLAEIEAFKEDEEMKRLNALYADEIAEIERNPVKLRKVVKRMPDGSEKEYLFVPDGTEDETYVARCAEAVLKSLPECNEEYVRSEMERTGASAEEVIAYYLALVESVAESGEIPDIDYDDIPK